MGDSTPRPGSRREFFLTASKAGALAAGASGAAWWLSTQSHRPEWPAASTFDRSYAIAEHPGYPKVSIVRGGAPETAVRRAIAWLGGIERFVERGDVVVLKPNMAWDRTPEQAANTSPAVVAEVARLAFNAGARRVVIADNSIHNAERVAERSGIGEAARAAGAEIILPTGERFRDVDLRGDVLRVWPVFTPLLEADKVINLPVAKHHSLTGATLGIKNWYGILGGTRRALHQSIHESLADLAYFMRPTLTVLDAWRVLMRNGPSGGNLEDVELKRTIIAGTDPVAVDARAAAEFWRLDQYALRYLLLASARGLGRVDTPAAEESLTG